MLSKYNMRKKNLIALRLNEARGSFLLNKSEVQSIRCPIALAIYVFLKSMPDGSVVLHQEIADRFGIKESKVANSFKELEVLFANTKDGEDRCAKCGSREC